LNRISRKELKKDEFAEEVSKTYLFFQEHRQELIRYGIVAALVACLALGGYWLYNSRKRQAHTELAGAVDVMYADPAVPGPAMNFATTKARDEAAEKQFAGIAQKYSHLEEGRIARYYMAMAENSLGKTDAAIRDLREVAGNNDQKVAPLARFALANVYASKGNTAEAQKLYQELINNPSDTVPKQTAQLALADMLSSSKPDEARKILVEISKETPKSAAAQVAQRRLTEIRQ
jgi:TolA-binding protein